MLKVRCVLCDELMAFNEEADIFNCPCGVTIQLPPGQAQADPYSGWQTVYNSDLKRKRPDANTGSRGRKRKPPAKPPARFSSNYYDV